VEVLSQLDRIDELASLGLKAHVYVGPLYAWLGTAMAKETSGDLLIDRHDGLEIGTRADIGVCRDAWQAVRERLKEVGWT
jgi:hypothetical protein